MSSNHSVDSSSLLLAPYPPLLLASLAYPIFVPMPSSLLPLLDLSPLSSLQILIPIPSPPPARSLPRFTRKFGRAISPEPKSNPRIYWEIPPFRSEVRKLGKIRKIPRAVIVALPLFSSLSLYFISYLKL